MHTETEAKTISVNAKGRSEHLFWLWSLVAVVDAAGLLCLHETHTFINIDNWKQFVFLSLLTTALVSAPLIRFLSHGWQDRYEEFRNRLTDGSLNSYLKQFWERRALKVSSEIFNKANSNSYALAEKLFDVIYREQYGQNVFVIPLILLLATTFFSSCLVLMIALEGYNLYQTKRRALLHKSSLTGTFPSPHEFTRYGRTEGVPARSCD